MTWTLPTQNIDNSALIDLAYLHVYRSATNNFATATALASQVVRMLRKPVNPAANSANVISPERS